MRDGYQGIKDAGAAELIAISNDSPWGVNNTQQDNNITYLMLSDENDVTITDYNVKDQNPLNRHHARPTAYIIGEDGKIAWKDLGERFGYRTDSQQIIAALQGL